jgi:hypothetical protein
LNVRNRDNQAPERNSNSQNVNILDMYEIRIIPDFYITAAVQANTFSI